MLPKSQKLWSILCLILVTALQVLIHSEAFLNVSTHSDQYFQIAGERIVLGANLFLMFCFAYLFIKLGADKPTGRPKTPVQILLGVTIIQCQFLSTGWRNFFPLDHFQPSAGIRTIWGSLLGGAFLFVALSLLERRKKKNPMSGEGYELIAQD